MDVKELKLLGDFNHPNIVRFMGVSVPANPRDTPVMIISELCANGDLFDYVRNVDPPTLYRVVSAASSFQRFSSSLTVSSYRSCRISLRV